jgi:peptide-methionine (S)-S-oxide reductase
MNEIDSPSTVPAIDRRVPDNLQTATFAMGCFWGPDAEFRTKRGVWRTRVGYTGGSTDAPEYHNLADHKEAIQIDFDPDVFLFEKLAGLFCRRHGPGAKGRKQQYRWAFWYHNDQQAEIIRSAQQCVSKETNASIEMYVAPVASFHRAEDRHQKHRLQHSLLMPYFRTMYPHFHDFVDSTAAARVNGLVSCKADMTLLTEEIFDYGIPSDNLFAYSQFVSTDQTTGHCKHS